jgi:dihydrofolate reductase
MQKVIIAAVTLDGKIAKSKNHNVDWTSKEDKQFFRQEVQKAGVVIFGANTYQTMGKVMPGVLNIIMTREPQKFIDQYKSNLLEFTCDPPRVLLNHLQAKGYEKVVIAGGSTIYSLFLKEDLVDEIYLTIAPKIFGFGMPLFTDMRIEESSWELMEVRQLAKGEVLVRYKKI